MRCESLSQCYVIKDRFRPAIKLITSALFILFIMELLSIFFGLFNLWIKRQTPTVTLRISVHAIIRGYRRSV